ncbi:hypothetical protein BCR22_07415 [Enterococcus plantarum]|uniref:phage tail tip lysozyme n=1 Tax=Enterococcus plantarum TaxID=1077675 RepID=UPI00084DD642|nr:phage tail tip lysozyme [Enterococcus plantarum]OEG09415.1 hypothetical protein BCR22_07415 [Enterococcus plantarum]
MSEHIYFFDDCQQLIKIVNEDKILESIQDKEITTSKEELLNSTLSVTITFDAELKEAAFMAVKEKDNFYALYRIVKINDPENQLMFVGVDFAPDELEGYIVKDIRPKNESIRSITKRLLEGTEWALGNVDSAIKNMSGTFYYISVKDALKQLQALGCEILFSCNLNANGISEKRVNIYQRIGTDSTTRYTYGDKALTVVKELDRNQLFTSIIGRGKGEEVGDGYGRRLEFSDLEWKKSKGDPLDKPKGQNWLEYPEMTKLYGIPTKDGKMRKREKVVVFDDEEDKKSLLINTYSELIECSRPLVQFKATITEGDVIGNTVTIHRYDRGYHYKTRIFKTKLDRLTGVTEASIGDNLTSNISRKTSQMVSGLQSLESNKMNFYSSEEISKWQSDIIRGAKGGSILLMSPSDLGVSQSREPYQMVWMNGDSLDTSDHFLVANSEGIGFIDGDFNLDNFKTAWTIDGVFNADFIKAGTLEGILFRTTFEKSATGIEIEKGRISFIGFDSKSRIGRLTPSSAKEGEGISITLEKGKYLSFHDGEGTMIFEIPVNSTQKSPALNTFGKHTHKGELHVDRLFVGGKEVVPGQGSGGGGGTPPGLTTEQEKNAWAIWSYFKARGWTEEAIAGMLGNMQSESGIVADIDELSGGGGYGLVQWTPKSKLVDWCNARGLNYRTIDAQCQRIQWEMENEQQWIATNSYPYSFKAFTSKKNISECAYAFITNYERPLNPNQPIRATQAQHWYDKLHGLTGDGSWKNPVRSSYVVTQEWDAPDYWSGGSAGIHGGIDLASVPAGSTPDIYAAKSGTILITGVGSVEGNYIMIDHGEGFYTYYGHLSSVKVKQGDKVTNNTVIGTMGTTGGSTGVHLHFEVRKGGQSSNFRINPRDVINF